MLDRIRLIAAGLLGVLVLVVFLHDLVLDEDYHWPVSTYPMYSIMLKPGEILRLYGLTEDGKEEAIFSWGPLDPARLRTALEGMDEETQRQALAGLLKSSKYKGLRLRRGDRVLADVMR